MLTVEQFLKAGFKFAAGDKICEIDNNKIWTLTTDSVDYWNNCDKTFDNYFIEDLIWRKSPYNKLPLPDDCWVQYKTRSPYCTTTDKAKNVIKPKNTCVDITWRPSIEYTLDELRNKICK